MNKVRNVSSPEQDWMPGEQKGQLFCAQVWWRPTGGVKERCWTPGGRELLGFCERHVARITSSLFPLLAAFVLS